MADEIGDFPRLRRLDIGGEAGASLTGTVANLESSACGAPRPHEALIGQLPHRQAREPGEDPDRNGQTN